MITAFMVFQKIQIIDGFVVNASGTANVPGFGWKLYFTTTEIAEDRIKEDANTFGWHVVKVTLDDELMGHCEVL